MNGVYKLIGVGAMVWPAVFHGRDKKQPIFLRALSRILTVLRLLSFLIDIYIANKWPGLKNGLSLPLFQMPVCSLKLKGGDNVHLFHFIAVWTHGFISHPSCFLYIISWGIIGWQSLVHLQNPRFIHFIQCVSAGLLTDCGSPLRELGKIFHPNLI